MARPALVVVNGNPGTLTALEQALRRRYGADYQVLAVAAPAAALAALEHLSEAGDLVALLMADQCLLGMDGVEFLSQAHQLHPAAKRVLLVTYGDVGAWISGLQAMALGQLDYWLNAPWGPPELQLYPAVSELLGQWARATASAGLPPELVRVIGPRWSARSHELRDLLGRNNIPHGFYDTEDEDGRQLLAQARVEAIAQPVLVLSDGQVLADPTNEQLARALGVPTRPAAEGYDVAVVGAGPAGLAAATYAASEGLRTLLLERRATGGQAGTTSLIRNYLGFPRGISGGELATRATEQALSFGAELAAQPVTRLHASDADWVLTLADGNQAVSRTVIIATGVSYRRLPVRGVEALLGAGVFYGAAVTEAQAMEGQRVVVVGGANSAGQAAAHLARHAEQVTLLVRGNSLAASMSAYLIAELERASNITVQLRTEVTAVHGTGRLDALTLHDHSTGLTTTLPAAALFILIGAEPHTGWLEATVEQDENGFLLTGRDLVRDRMRRPAWPMDRAPLLLETSQPGVFAAGDVRHGSIKRVASAVGEGATAVQLVHQYLDDTTPDGR